MQEKYLILILHVRTSAFIFRVFRIFVLAPINPDHVTTYPQTHNNLSFASAQQPYLQADRPIGKSLSRGRERKGNSPVDYFSEQPGGTARDLGIG